MHLQVSKASQNRTRTETFSTGKYFDQSMHGVMFTINLGKGFVEMGCQHFHTPILNHFFPFSSLQWYCEYNLRGISHTRAKRTAPESEFSEPLRNCVSNSNLFSLSEAKTCFHRQPGVRIVQF
jgi:hypothetical protein